MFHAAPKYDRPSPEVASFSGIAPASAIGAEANGADIPGINCIANTDIKSPLIVRDSGDITISDEIAAAFVSRLAAAQAHGVFFYETEAEYQRKYRVLFNAMVRELEIIGPGACRAELCQMILRLDEKHCRSGSHAYSVVSEKVKNRIGYSFRFLNAADRNVIVQHFIEKDAR